jgi:hypothetical protein
MQNLTFSEPGLLFPAISLLMLAYTNRFLGLASVARALVTKYRDTHDETTGAQIVSLRRRLLLTRHTQTLGVLSLSSCVGCIFSLFIGTQAPARVLFSGALVLMVASLIVSLAEIHLSVHAIDLEISSMKRV